MKQNFYEFSALSLQGKEVGMDKYKGKVVLVVNTASKCGLTPQFEGLEKLYKDYKDSGLVILGFPCNQFANQEPGSEKDIAEGCLINYGVTFPMFSKIDVNGPNEEPLYKYLKTAVEEFRNQETVDFYNKVKQYTPNIVENDIRWNFTKFLIDKEGNVIARFATNITAEEMDEHIAKLVKDEEVEIVCHSDFSQGCL